MAWTWNLDDVRRVVYRLPELAEQTRVVFVEGEKDADRLWSLGIPATTAPSGARSWRDDYAQQLAAAAVQDLVVIPDNDEPGRKYARQVAAAVLRCGLRTRLLELPGLAAKGDVSNWLDAGHDVDELSALLDGAPAFAVEEYSQAEGTAVLIRIADVQAEAVEWLWPNRIARGKLALFVGDPGGGKTFLTSGDMAARISTGRGWPDGALTPEGAVIVLTSEDGLADTLRPRLDLQGGDPLRVFVLRGVKSGDTEIAFTIDRDLSTLESAITSTQAVLVIIDPLSAYLGHRDSYKDAEIRSILGPLAQLAERLRVAVVGVLHLTKDQQRRLLLRAQGSIAFVAQARTVLAVGEDPDTPGRRLLVCIKNNLGVMAPTLAFRIGDNGLTWDSGTVDGRPDHLLAGDEVATRSERRELETAVAFLRTLLAGGLVPSKQVEADAKANGIAQRTLWRAKAELGITTEQSTVTGKRAWYWTLPASEASA